ncbi:MAG: ribosomal RNA small subunit methyltransferase A [Geothrix sp.]|uniref:16S rRNA (adenine(1518)-N(6)/adenine(1519)-N(6))- dimethyltransferase RsmA n=1 Tax=Geothrix sp. TaxID=1962974 RepID=UPI00185BA280|nr:16S rRNA (adenine(1518)-N(6)/adenine(1519)-N(6))-dimethyltransferase RsmA [Geothrix sp.]NWJ40125.1 ribosomal RNA small subunit methyltransferase A [Geothrix sp.]WIL21866.1 MAG: 16S rRNA (adenine(1518)-N(6)/adenine(1519)-N(6))-dimethyltransferase RsmA [Geothrix sp.]
MVRWGVPDPSPIARLRPKKAFGQNFLVNDGAIATIVGAAVASDAPRLLEIGPGPGVLTERLLADGRPLWAVDLDPEACELLQTRFGGCPQFHLLQGDAVRIPLPEGGPWSVIGNLPYNAATPILARLLTEGVAWERMVLMFQLEVAQKLMGIPGTKAYGPLSVLAQLCARLTRLVKLGPGSFRPAPKVDSAVVLFEPRQDAPLLQERRALLQVLHRSFAHRRKTLANNWQGVLSAEALSKAGITSALRAEVIAPSAWLLATRELLNHHPEVFPSSCP